MPKTVARLIFRMSVLPGVEFSGSPIRSPKDSGFDGLLRFTYPHTQVEFEATLAFEYLAKNSSARYRVKALVSWIRSNAPVVLFRSCANNTGLAHLFLVPLRLIWAVNILNRSAHSFPAVVLGMSHCNRCTQ